MLGDAGLIKTRLCFGIAAVCFVSKQTFATAIAIAPLDMCRRRTLALST
jgi:hypothetical protein